MLGVGDDPEFARLLAEGEAVPVEGWDFSWFDGRATEERPSWGYARMMAERMAHARAALDIQTGGGEVLAGIPEPPPLLVATESWPPNAELARRTLAPLGGRVVQATDDAGLPFPAESFDLVVSRHPVQLVWPEIARVLRPGGTFFSQLVGAGSNRELSDFMMGPQPVSKARSTRRRASPSWPSQPETVAQPAICKIRLTSCDPVRVRPVLKVPCRDRCRRGHP